jgi:hypothetical protein
MSPIWDLFRISLCGVRLERRENVIMTYLIQNLWMLHFRVDLSSALVLGFDALGVVVSFISTRDDPLIRHNSAYYRLAFSHLFQITLHTLIV